MRKTIAIAAMLANAWVMYVEDGEPESVNDSGKDTPSFSGLRIFFRIAGGVVGVGAIWLGVAFFGEAEISTSWWNRYVVPTGFVFMGAWFLHYAVTGNQAFRRKRE